MAQAITPTDFHTFETEASGKRFPNDSEVLHITVDSGTSNPDKIITFPNDGNTLLLTEWTLGRTTGVTLVADVTGTFHALNTETSYADDITLTLSGAENETHLHGPFPTVYFGDEVTVTVTGNVISGTLRLGALKR